MTSPYTNSLEIMLVPKAISTWTPPLDKGVNEDCTYLISVDRYKHVA